MKGPRIVVEPPGPKSKRAMSLKESYVTPGLRVALPICLAKAEGPFLTDVDGNTYIDLSVGIGVQNTGHRPREVIEAVKNQLDRLTHICFMVAMYDPYIELARRMAEITPGNLSKSLFVNSGSEAVENAVKIARAYTKKKHIVSFRTAFHGRTLLDISLTGKMKPYKEGFGPFFPDVVHQEYAYCYRCPLNMEYPECDLACVETIRENVEEPPLARDTCALISEPIQGEGGFIVPPPGYFEKLSKVCSDNGMLFIDDEVQAGMGRAGKMWAIENWNVVPDILVSGKALGGGLPIGGVTGKEEIMSAPGPASLGGTFGGSPMSCAAGLKSIELVKKALPNVKILERTLRKRLQEFQESFGTIGDVRGLGAMWAFELVTDGKSKEPAAELARAIQLECMKKGLILLTAGYFNNVIRLLPPLNLDSELLESALDILEASLKSARA